jgi:hypothetical protein
VVIHLSLSDRSLFYGGIGSVLYSLIELGLAVRRMRRDNIEARAVYEHPRQTYLTAPYETPYDQWTELRHSSGLGITDPTLNVMLQQAGKVELEVVSGVWQPPDKYERVRRQRRIERAEVR